MPVLLLLHEDAQTPDGIIDETAFEELADQENFILAALQRDGRESGPVDAMLDALFDQHCIDEERVYVLGHGAGGDLVDDMRDTNVFAAAVATAHRLHRSHHTARLFLRQAGTVPYLLLTGREDGHEPLEGNDTKVSLEAHEAVLKHEHQCDEASERAVEVEGGACRTWQCETDLQSCTIEGDRHWPAHPGGAKSAFDHQRFVWEFLRSYRRGKSTLDGGCGTPRAGGRLELGPDVAYLPRSYNSRRSYPLIIALHELGQNPTEMLDELGLDELADEQGFIVYAAAGPTHRDIPSWENELVFAEFGESLLAHFDSAYRRALDSLCIDPDRAYVVGHASSGRFVESLRGDDRFAAVATFSFRPNTGEAMAESKDRVAAPYLYVVPLDDPADPPGAAPNRRAIADHENALSLSHRCAETRTESHDFGHSHCWTWDDCSHELVSCQIQGNRHWPGHPHGAPSDFEHQQVLWEFLARHRR